MGIQKLGTGILAALCALVAAGRADAIAFVFDGAGGYGISASRAAAAEADGLQIIDVDELFTADALGISVPSRVVDLPTLVISPSPSPSNPSSVDSAWTVTTSGHGNLVDAWLVFYNTSANYSSALVGFEADDEEGWAVFSVFAAGSEYFYPAVHLGDFDPSNPVVFTMHHLVGQTLLTNGSGQLELPRYTVGSIEGIPLPEPSALALGAAGLALLALLRLRNA